MIRNELSEASALSEVLPSLVRPSVTEAGRYADGISESARVLVIHSAIVLKASAVYVGEVCDLVGKFG